MAWRTEAQPVPNRAPAIVILWHAQKETALNMLECAELPPPGITLIRFTGIKPQGMVCVECVSIIKERSIS